MAELWECGDVIIQQNDRIGFNPADVYFGVWSADGSTYRGAVHVYTTSTGFINFGRMAAQYPYVYYALHGTFSTNPTHHIFRVHDSSGIVEDIVTLDGALATLEVGMCFDSQINFYHYDYDPGTNLPVISKRGLDAPGTLIQNYPWDPNDPNYIQGDLSYYNAAVIAVNPEGTIAYFSNTGGSRSDFPSDITVINRMDLVTGDLMAPFDVGAPPGYFVCDSVGNIHIITDPDPTVPQGNLTRLRVFSPDGTQLSSDVVTPGSGGSERYSLALSEDESTSWILQSANNLTEFTADPLPVGSNSQIVASSGTGSTGFSWNVGVMKCGINPPGGFAAECGDVFISTHLSNLQVEIWRSGFYAKSIDLGVIDDTLSSMDFDGFGSLYVLGQAGVIYVIDSNFLVTLWDITPEGWSVVTNIHLDSSSNVYVVGIIGADFVIRKYDINRNIISTQVLELPTDYSGGEIFADGSTYIYTSRTTGLIYIYDMLTSTQQPEIDLSAGGLTPCAVRIRGSDGSILINMITQGFIRVYSADFSTWVDKGTTTGDIIDSMQISYADDTLVYVSHGGVAASNPVEIVDLVSGATANAFLPIGTSNVFEPIAVLCVGGGSAYPITFQGECSDVVVGSSPSGTAKTLLEFWRGGSKIFSMTIPQIASGSIGTNIIVDHEGNIYIPQLFEEAAENTWPVIKLPANNLLYGGLSGTPQSWWTPPVNEHPVAISIDRNGFIYVLVVAGDQQWVNCTVINLYKLDSAGTLISSYLNLPVPAGHNAASGLRSGGAVNRDGTFVLYSFGDGTDMVISKYILATSEYSVFATDPGFTNTYPQGMLIDGLVVIGNEDGINIALASWRLNGSQRKNYNSNNGFYGGGGIAANNINNQVVASESGNGEVYKIDLRTNLNPTVLFTVTNLSGGFLLPVVVLCPGRINGGRSGGFATLIGAT